MQVTIRITVLVLEMIVINQLRWNYGLVLGKSNFLIKTNPILISVLSIHALEASIIYRLMVWIGRFVDIIQLMRNPSGC